MSIDDPDARLNALMTGEVDLGDVNLAQADQARDEGLELATFPGVHYSLMFFDRGPGGAVEDPAVRHAICDSVDTDGLAEVGGSDFLTASNQRFQEGEYGHSDEIPPLSYDPDRAAPVLDGVGPLAMMAFEQNQPAAEGVAGLLGEVGVELDVEVVPAASTSPAGTTAATRSGSATAPNSLPRSGTGPGSRPTRPTTRPASSHPSSRQRRPQPWPRSTLLPPNHCGPT